MKFTRRDVVFFLIASGLVAFYVFYADGGFPLDDSWIHQVYGRNLGDHGEWAFILGEPSAASTAPFYTLLLAIGYLFNIPYMFWTHLLGVIALTLTAMFGARIAEKLSPKNGWIGFFTGLTLLFTWHLIWAAASGMETMLFSMFTLALIYLAFNEVDNTGTTKQIIIRGVIFGIVTAMATTTRPEGILLAAIIGLLSLISGDRKQAIVWGIAALSVFIIAMLPYLFLNLHLADSLLPNTSTAKFAQHRPLLAEPYIERVFGMMLPILVGGQIVLLPGVVYYAVKYAKQRIYLTPLLWFLGLAMLYAARLPATYQHGRYVIPALPSLITMGVVGMVMLFKVSQTNAIGRIFTRTMVVTGAITFIYFALALGREAYKTDVQLIDEEMVTQAKWIAENIPEDELLAIHDIGAVGYFAPRPLVDIAGLLNPDVAELIGDEVGLWNLMETGGAAYLMAFANQIPGQSTDDERLCPIHQTEGELTEKLGGTKMVIYRLLWNNSVDCDVQRERG